MKEKGISLVSLVVAIIILLILAVVSIGVAGGNNGLFTRTRKTVDTSEVEALKENIQMQLLDKELEKAKKGEKFTQQDIEEILSKYGTVNKSEDGTILDLTVKEKDYLIPYQEIYIPSEMQIGESNIANISNDEITISRTEYNNIIERLDALDGGSKSTLTLGNMYEQINKKLPTYKSIRENGTFTGKTELTSTGVSVKIPANSYYSISAISIWNYAKPEEMVIVDNETDMHKSSVYVSSNSGVTNLDCSYSEFTQTGKTLYVWAKYADEAQSMASIRGYYVTFSQ